MSRERWITLGLSAYAVCSLISMAVMSLGAVFLVLCCLIGFRGPVGLGKSLSDPFRGSSGNWVRSYLWVSLALALACLLSLVVARFHPLVFSGKAPEIRFLWDMSKAWYLAWPCFLLLAWKGAEERGRVLALRAWLATAGLLGVLGIIQYFTGWPRRQVIPTDLAHYHATLFIGHHLSVASILIFPFFKALDGLGAKSRLRLMPGGLLLAVVLLSGVALFLTYSRMLWVSLPIGLGIWFLWQLPRRLSAVLLAVSLPLGWFVSKLPMIQSRLQNDMGIHERRMLWKANWDFFLQRPHTGTGWHHNLEVYAHYLESTIGLHEHSFVGHAHNNLLEMLASTGWIGALAWLVWCGLGLFLAWRLRLKWLFCAWIVFQLNGLTQVNFWDSKVLHQIMFVTGLGLWESLRAKREPLEEA